MRSRSIFWPLVLIAIGVIWLLINLQTVPVANLWALYNGLPYLLVLLGLGLILRARWPLAGRIVTSLVVGCALLAVVFAAPLGWNTPPDWGCIWGESPLEGCIINIDMGGGVRGSGVVVSETRTVPEFSAVSVDFPAEVTIRQGETQSVTVEAEDNFLPQLLTRVSGDTLHIEAQGIAFAQRVNPTRPVKVSLTVKDLREVDFSSAGSVEVVNLKTDSLSISASGAGRINLHKLEVRSLRVELSGAGSVEADGTAEDVALEISGVGSFQAEGLSAQTARAELSGMGSATLWVTRQLTAEISGTGSVNYYGSPDVQKEVSGLGSIRKLGDK